MIDIIMDEATDKVVMSVEFAEAILSASEAKSLLEEWATTVRAALGMEL